MSSVSALTIHPCSNKNILVQGDYDTYAKAMKRFSGRWNTRAKAGPGWLVPIEFESAVREHFGLEDDTASSSQRYRAAPQKVHKEAREDRKDRGHENREDHEDHGDSEDRDAGHDDHDHEEQPPTPPRSQKAKAPAPKAPVSKAPVKPVPSSKPVAKMATNGVSHGYDNEQEDIVSLSRRMKDVMTRLERLETR